ncbi:hypothetical protein [Bacillus rhizoplanae]|uniref:hypothetical protein n=1 Tax=Bacillus rhizoplanae TaxID=2880966 RepID=UPI003D23A584
MKQKKLRGKMVNNPGVIIFSFVIIFLIIFCFIAPKLPLFHYDIDNYRYTYSSVLQTIGALFAFIASSTILLLQLSGDNSPKSLSFFPKIRFYLVMILLFIVLMVDGSILLFLPKDKISNLRLTINNVILVLNGVVVIYVITYVMSVINWLKPETTINMLVERAKKSSTNEERLEIIFSLEELAIKAIQRGYSSTLNSITNAYSDVVGIYFKINPDLNKNSNRGINNPIRKLPQSLTRIALNLCNSSMEDLVPNIGWVFRKLAIYSDNNSEDYVKRMDDAELVEAVGRVIEECSKNNLNSVGYNFVANIAISSKGDKDKVSLKSWILSEAVENAIPNPVIVSRVLRGLADLKYSEKEKGFVTRSKENAINKILEHPDILQSKGWFTNKTIQEQINSLIENNK